MTNLVTGTHTATGMADLLSTLTTRYEFYYGTVIASMADYTPTCVKRYDDTVYEFYEITIDPGAWGSNRVAEAALIVLKYVRGSVESIYVSRETDHDDVAIFTMPF